jgi:hypothetical protein
MKCCHNTAFPGNLGVGWWEVKVILTTVFQSWKLKITIIEADISKLTLPK